MHILAVKPVFCLGVTIYVIGKTGSILGYKRGCFEFFNTSHSRLHSGLIRRVFSFGSFYLFSGIFSGQILAYIV